MPIFFYNFKCPSRRSCLDQESEAFVTSRYSTVGLIPFLATMSTDDLQNISPATTDSPGVVQPRRKHPCVLCQQRKVKCDRSDPCANCTKARVECISPTTLPPKRRKKRFPEAELLARLRRYEEALKIYGVDIDALNAEGGSVPVESVLSVQLKNPPPLESAAERLNAIKSLAVRRSLKHVKR
jgi:Fungal Zn(2)-Cys(6) binuclear cluster domain